MLALWTIAYILPSPAAAADLYYTIYYGDTVRITVNNYGQHTVGYDHSSTVGLIEAVYDMSFDVTYTSRNGFVGTDVFTYTAYNDAGVAVASDTLHITVKPKITFSSSTWPNAKQGEAYSQSVTASFNAGSQSVSYWVSAGTLPAGLSLDPQTGTISGTPSASGTSYFQFHATNGDGDSALQSMKIVVGPQIDDVAATVAANSSDNVVSLGLSGALSVTGVSPPSYGTAAATGAVLTYTPHPGYSGSDSFSYTVTDSTTGLSDTATVTVTVTPPTLSLAPENLPNGTTTVGYNQNLSALYGTAPYSYSVSAGAIPAGLTLSNDGTLSGIPSAPGIFQFSITATDAYGAMGSRAYSLEVRIAAPIAANVEANVSANSTNNPITLALSGGTASSVSVASDPAHGTTSVIGTSITYTPDAGYSGQDSFTYEARNTTGPSAPATVTVTVAPPTLAISPSTIPPATAAAPYSQALSAANGTAPYSFEVTTGALPDGLSLTSNGIVSGTPSIEGTTAFEVTVTDAYGAKGRLSYTMSIAIAPPIAGDVNAAVDANSADNAITLALSGGAADSLEIASAPSHGTAAASGTTITYTPTAGYSGSDSFTYTASNATGTSDPATVTITVAKPQLALTPTGTLTLRQAEAFTQAFSADGGTAPYDYALGGDLPDGLSFDRARGVLSGTPEIMGNFPLTLTATDLYGATLSTAITLDIAEARPVAPSITVPTNSGRTVTIDLTEGATGGPFTGANLLSISPANAGTAVIVLDDTAASDPAASFAAALSAGRYKLRFTANPDFTGTFVASYTLTGASGTSAPASVQIQVSARPILSADPDLVGLVQAQAAAASRLADSQIENISDHLRSLHGSSCLKNTVSVTMTDGADGQAPVNVETACSALAGGNLAIWSSGSIDLGDSDSLNGESAYDFATLSLTGGIDYRLSETIIGGLAIGYARDRTAIGSNGTSSVNEAASASLYGVYQPGGGLFVEGSVGAALLSFESLRTTPSGREAEASRSGSQVFGVLTGGYDYASGDLKVTSYARIRASHSVLDDTKETGADWENAQFGDMESDSLAATLGLIVGYDIAIEDATLTPELSLDFSKEFLETGTSTVTYADDNWPIDYVIPGSSSNRDTMTLGFGFTVAKQGAATVSGRYKTSFNGEGIQSQRFAVDINGQF
ncbi:putative Ig domain-containing protein [Rhizobium sp. G187]|uniref:putative Ig domain-containing protein n=1 Tax=Rhizobium sp. G187 TaxID=3451352 RepID=UPI003EE70CE6